MGKKRPIKVLNLPNKSKENTPKPKELPTFTYWHSCAICGRLVDETISHRFLSETRGIGFCKQCDMEVETIILLHNATSPNTIYSKENPYTENDN